MRKGKVLWRIRPAKPWPASWDREGGSHAGHPRVEDPQGPSYVGGGHLDPEQCDRFETVLERALGEMPEPDRQAWFKSFKPRRR